MIPEDPRVTELWWALHLVALRYVIGNAVAFGRTGRATELIQLYPEAAAVHRAAVAAL